MHPFLDTILTITERAEAIPRKYFRRQIQIDQKADDSPVTKADRAAESLIREALAAQFPEHAIHGEEFGRSGGDGAYMWVIDPIDGTRSFISGMPLYGMLVALLNDGRAELGIMRMPELGEVYTGTPQGAFLNTDTALRVSATTRLDQAFLYVNEPDKLMADDPATFARLGRAGRDRRFCYDCYPHALVASGHADACVDYDLKPYDYMALVPIVRGAGGVISDWQGKELGMHSDGRIVSAATPQLHGALLDLLNGG
jgi:histidinol phosphatase-like enzyme (inositol monophosphatase family)